MLNKLLNKKYIVPAIIAVISIVLIYAIYRIFIYDPKDQYNIAYGVVDIKQSNLTFQRSGQINHIFVKEGDFVSKDQVLATLDTQDLEHNIKIQQNSCDVLNEQLQELYIGYRQEDINKAYQTYLSNLNNYNLAKMTEQRYAKLYASKSISAQDYDNAKYNTLKLKGICKASYEDYLRLKSGYTNEQIKAQEYQVKQCQSTLEYLEYQKDEQSIIKAPFSGTILEQYLQLADMAGPQSIVFAITNDVNKEIKVYLSAKAIETLNLKVSDKTKVYTDLENTKFVTGTISFISNTAMFTPKNVATTELRSDLVYEIRIKVDDIHKDLRFGQNVTVDFAK